MPRVLIIGLGLMGGSAGLALQRAGWEVGYIDPAVDGAPFEKRGAPRDEEVVLLATHVDGALAWLTRLQTPGVVTSVCSVMTPLREAWRRPAGAGRPRAAVPAQFVAGHPMAGSDKSGFAHADADLYKDKIWFLDAHDERVEQLVRDCGATARFVDAREHDEAVALTSHLPQVLSTALAAYLHDRDLGDFAGSGLRDFLRLANMPAEMWAPILEHNAANIAPHAEGVAKIVRELLAGDPGAFERARAFLKR